MLPKPDRPRLTVIDGWRRDEQRVEAIAGWDEQIADATDAATIALALDAAYGDAFRPDLRFRRLEQALARMLTRATRCRAEILALGGGDVA